MEIQKDAFIKYEADNYFRRNQTILKSYTIDNDPIIKVLMDYNYNPKRVLEIGCNAGYRLNGFRSIFPNSELYGLEPSTEAINYGKKHFDSSINFVQGTADDLTSFDTSSFDLVIIGFLLYVVDRTILLKTISEIDRVIANKGILMNIDFFAQTPHKNLYTHINKTEAYTYKQNYEDIFISSRLYQLTDKRSFNHAGKNYDISHDFKGKITVSLMQKDIETGYI